MKTFKHLTIYALSLLVLTGCFKGDDNLEKYWVNIATVKNPENKNEFFFKLDDNTLMWTETSIYRDYKPVDGQRIIANYSILSDKTATGVYDYDVKVNDVYEVLTKNIYAVVPTTQDSIGNDSILVEDGSIWIGSHYLNVEFMYQGASKTHFINLVQDNSKTYNDGKIHLELRHNANNDVPMYNLRGIASFDLSPLKNSATDSVKLAIHVNLPNKVADTIFERTYNYKTTPSNVKRRAVSTIFSNKRNVDVE